MARGARDAPRRTRVDGLLIAHLSDLHLRDAGDATWLDHQLDRIAARNPDHLAITGDLLDRWTPQILDRAIASLDARGFLHRDRLTVLHGNHDLASSGGHPRRGADLWRLATRFWDPPPLIAWRRRRFYSRLARHAAELGGEAPFSKTLASGLRIAVIDSVPLLWRPVRFEARRTLVVQHAVGCIREPHAEWLAAIPPDRGPLLLLLHHYPLDTPAFQWSPDRPSRLHGTTVRVPMHIPDPGRSLMWEAARAAGVRLVLCGHVHRARLEHHGRIAVGLNGQSGAAWAGRTIAWYDIGADSVTMDVETVG